MAGVDGTLSGRFVGTPLADFGPGGSINQVIYGTINSNSLTGGDFALADNSRNLGLDPEEDRYGAFGRVRFELAPWIEVFAEASYNEQETLFNAGPQLITAGASVTLRNDNAYLINTLGAARLTGITTVTLGTTAVDLPFRKSANERDTQRYAIGAEGAFGLFASRRSGTSTANMAGPTRASSCATS